MPTPIPWTKALRDRWRLLLREGSFSAPMSKYSPISSLPPISFSIAQRLIMNYWLLYFDEIQLLDVSSAGLISDVLSWFWRMGGVVVATSNKVPDDLYRNGVQRERLERFVDALKARCTIVEMRGTQDWRKEAQESTYWFMRHTRQEFESVVEAALPAEIGQSKWFNLAYQPLRPSQSGPKPSASSSVQLQLDWQCRILVGWHSPIFVTA